jgi:hypothetical protein
VPLRCRLRRYAGQAPKHGDRSSVTLSSDGEALVCCAAAADRQSPSARSRSALRFAIIIVVVMLVPPHAPAQLRASQVNANARHSQTSDRPSAAARDAGPPPCRALRAAGRERSAERRTPRRPGLDHFNCFDVARAKGVGRPGAGSCRCSTRQGSGTRAHRVDLPLQAAGEAERLQQLLGRRAKKHCAWAP